MPDVQNTIGQINDALDRVAQSHNDPNRLQQAVDQVKALLNQLTAQVGGGGKVPGDPGTPDQATQGSLQGAVPPGQRQTLNPGDQPPMGRGGPVEPA